MIDRYQPRPGQSTDDAIAELKDEFEVRIDNFTQDLKLDDIIQEQNQDNQVDPDFTSQRQQLLDRVNNWTPPEGTSPERAAEIRAELQSIVSRYNPAPGQPVDQAMAQLQYQFDARVRDFEQEDKIDILIGQEQGEQGSETPASETPGRRCPGPRPRRVARRRRLQDGGVVRPTVMPEWWKEGMPLPNADGSMPPGLEINVDGTFTYQPATADGGVVRPTVMPEWWKEGMPLPNADGSMPPGLQVNADGTFTYTPTGETPATETPDMETPGTETPATETPGMRPGD